MYFNAVVLLHKAFVKHPMPDLKHAYIFILALSSCYLVQSVLSTISVDTCHPLYSYAFIYIYWQSGLNDFLVGFLPPSNHSSTDQGNVKDVKAWCLLKKKSSESSNFCVPNSMQMSSWPTPKLCRIFFCSWMGPGGIHPRTLKEPGWCHRETSVNYL